MGNWGALGNSADTGAKTKGKGYLLGTFASGAAFVQDGHQKALGRESGHFCHVTEKQSSRMRQLSFEDTL